MDLEGACDPETRREGRKGKWDIEECRLSSDYMVNCLLRREGVCLAEMTRSL